MARQRSRILDLVSSEEIKMYKAFIFDFDGVLVDTTDIQVRSIMRALGRNGFDVRHPSDLDIVYSTITTKAKLVKFTNFKSWALADSYDNFRARALPMARPSRAP